MEQITVLEIPPTAWEYLREHGWAELVVHPAAENAYSPVAETPHASDISKRTVRITAGFIGRGTHQVLMLLTSNEEAALLLKSKLLTGLHRDTQLREKAAFAKGFQEALNMVGRI
jgi:hypothetical protein